MTRAKRRGFSMIEILVVLVVLLVGILSAIRIFPLALVGLSNTRDFTLAQVVARRQLDTLAGRANDLPQQILAVKYTYVQVGGNWQLVLLSDPDTNPYDLSAGGQLLADGNIFIQDPGGGPGTLIPWRFYNDSNRVRRVIGEGGSIPAPRPVGSDFGGLRILSFAPIVNDPNLLLVYGDDMEGNSTTGTAAGDKINNPRPWTFVNDDEVAQVWLPGVAGRTVRYKLNFSYWVNNGGQYQRVSVIDKIVQVDNTVYDAVNNEVSPFSLQLLAGNPPNWVELAEGTVSANRLFDEVVGNFDPNYPYEYKVLNGNLGSILFNPVGYNYRERRGRGNFVPLRAQVNYDVYNWHVISDEFRADRTRSPIQKLSFPRVKALRDLQNDARRYPGLEIPIPDGNGGTILDSDFIVVDLDSGGIVSRQFNPNNPNDGLSYKVDYLRGVLALASPYLPDNRPDASQLSSQGIAIVLPDANQTRMVVDPAGRNFRVFYQVHNEWAVQVFKAAQRYVVVGGLPLGVAECYPGDGNIGYANRIYFPWCDLGAKVNIREIWYRDGSTNALRVMRDQDFLIRPPQNDPVGKPYVDIRDVDQNAGPMDASVYGYSVRGVAGISIRARVIWNPADKPDVPAGTPNEFAERMDLHEAWTRQWRRVQVESYLTRRDNN
jgi:prepilin-type N-terminal cleavage/methylation domain-containing protein